MDETEKHLQKSKALLPLRPIHLRDGESYHVQWPMTNLRAKEAQKAAQVFQARRMQEDVKPSFFEAKDFATTSNKEVASILDSTSKTADAAKTSQPKVNLEEAAWGDEIEIDAEDDIDV